jgi:hypothetical protein
VHHVLVARLVYELTYIVANIVWFARWLVGMALIDPQLLSPEEISAQADALKKRRTVS